MKTIIRSTVIYLFVFLSQLVYSQRFIPNYSFDWQIGGNAGLVGFKINRNFYTNKSNHFTFGLGVGSYRQEAYWRNPFVLSNDLSYSIQSKRNNGHFMELGISSMLAEKAFSNNESSLIGNQNFVVMPLLGYKYISKRFINLRIHTNPVISNQRFYFWGGLSLGLLLRNKNNDKKRIGSIRFVEE
jgi:hypothetical protein